MLDHYAVIQILMIIVFIAAAFTTVAIYIDKKIDTDAKKKVKEDYESQLHALCTQYKGYIFLPTAEVIATEDFLDHLCDIWNHHGFSFEEGFELVVDVDGNPCPAIIDVPVINRSAFNQRYLLWLDEQRAR